MTTTNVYVKGDVVGSWENLTNNSFLFKESEEDGIRYELKNAHLGTGSFDIGGSFVCICVV